MTSSHSLQRESKLKGWPAIVRYLTPIIGEWHIDTIKKHAERSKDPLPVKRFGGRIVADAEQLKAWAERQIA